MRDHVLTAFLALAVLAPAATAQPSSVDDQTRYAIRRTPVVEVFERARDAVVNISSTEVIRVRRSGIDRMFEDMFDLPRQPREYTRESVGSGFVIHSDGYIVTNAHVVAGTVERRVTFADGSEYDAEIIASDERTDVALLKIKADRALPVLPLGRSDDLMIGETVIAIGNPLGLRHTVTAGVVSALDRDLDFTRALTLNGLVQTDASINPGNSGGPLLNVLGELIGVNTAIRGDAQNIGFAIPVDALRLALPQLLDIERRYRLSTGLQVEALDTPRIQMVEPGSPAARAGLRVGDVVVAVADRPVVEAVDFYISLIGRRAGDALEVDVERGGQRVSHELVLERIPNPDGAVLALERLGLVVEPLPAETAARLGVRDGLAIVDVEAGSPADRLGVRRTDVLEAIDRRSVTSLLDLGLLLERTDAGDNVEITVLRVEGRSKYRLSGSLHAR